ncbi:SDR family oxidoreductase [Phyllobacterium sp. SYP-B3895]|uniref:SDR family oxidoreductase n=1 Tax=Phyllobacterium sp. SYP-B3895 TaxID=2663240 RepID=UPI00129A0044|nr:SDR family oxidoreductase [Phyllobacterium sp. SYP-B3895]MRG54535.1 SDR family oxidoreductase [Phyllobacterium sp. SYP-B3895]
MTHTDKRIAIVTGAARGIGAAVAERLANDGFAVVINYANSAREAEALAAKLSKAGQRAITVQADVAKAEEVRRMFDLVEAELGKVSVLVNNAGIMNVQPLAETSDAVFEQQFATNVQGTFNTMREAAGRMGDGDRIINFSTSVVGTNLPGYAVYAGTKAAVETFTRIFAKELRGRNITVNAVAPGPVATDLFLAGKSEELVQQLSKAAPMERLGQPDDIARVVSFLAGPDGGWINGQVVRANGGLV